ncbi:hypothetical protein [Mycolicibacterium mageritense]|uniref:hypothetical protein n=1 Tax=Mycolicibacterium mageritense TaxID=53462 RepID=UPI001E49F2E3|nr:hypothetical protein [Mycolicibacterium mageritense]MCC9186416.1 hypothetical protein [Mycolicibacterium mageritense]
MQRTKQIRLVFAIATVALLVGTLAAAFWPLRTPEKTSCGSFIVANSNVYNDAYQSNYGAMTDAAFDTGVRSENAIGLPTGAFNSVARKVANDEVTRCADKRQTTGITAGILLVLTLASAGAYFKSRQQGNLTPDLATTAGD